MDCGKDYIKDYILMCDCEEIQALTPNYTTFHKPYILSGEDSDSPYVIAASATEVLACEKKGKYKNIWLPRQDELQEILVNVNHAPLIMLIALFDHFAFEQGYENKVPPINIFSSMEQLWLAFVMKELYKKVWNGEDWIYGKEI